LRKNGQPKHLGVEEGRLFDIEIRNQKQSLDMCQADVIHARSATSDFFFGSNRDVSGNLQMPGKGLQKLDPSKPKIRGNPNCTQSGKA
jgi:hypothetical protein